MANKPLSILSIDGSGVRMSVAALMLERLEQKLQQHDSKKRLKDYFDLIAGSSTGSAIACAVAKGIEASAITQFCLSQATRMFPPFGNAFFGILRFFNPGYSHPIFDPTGIETVFQSENFLGRFLHFAELEKPTLVTSYDTYNRQGVIFNNTRPECENILVWEICRAAAVPPVAFPGYLFKQESFLQYLEHQEGRKITTDEGGNRCLPLIDGGVAFNNPTLLAIAEGMKWNNEPPSNSKWQIPSEINLENMVVASFGTGHTSNSINPKQISKWGLAEWVNPAQGIPLVEVFSGGCADMVSYITSQILKNNYFRFQPKLEQESLAFKTNTKQLQKLKQLTENFVNTPQIDESLEQLVRILIANQSS